MYACMYVFMYVYICICVRMWYMCVVRGQLSAVNSPSSMRLTGEITTPEPSYRPGSSCKSGIQGARRMGSWGEQGESSEPRASSSEPRASSAKRLVGFLDFPSAKVLRAGSPCPKLLHIVYSRIVQAAPCPEERLFYKQLLASF